MDTKNKRIAQKILVGRIYIVLSILIAVISVVVLWKNSYSPWKTVGMSSWLKLAALVIGYGAIYHFFAKMYRAYRFGIYRLTELMYSQFLAFGIANVVLYIEAGIFYHKLTSIVPFLVTYFFQMLAEAVIIFIVNRLYMCCYVPKEIVIVYGREASNYKDFVRKVESKHGRYIIRGIYDEQSVYHKGIPDIEGVESVYLYEVSREIKEYLVHYCYNREIDVYLTRTVIELLLEGFETSHTFDTPFLRTNREPVRWYYPYAKRLMDIVLSLIGLVVLSPIFLITALCIKLSDKGPVFYKQTRLTLNHKEFEIYKFRSMVVDAEKDGKARLAQEHDSRITPVGKIIRKTRIDEIPQIINILKGEMSFVGPRPERPEIEKEYLEILPEFGLRLKVKSGLTGYAQIFGKYNTTPQDKLRLDLLYINNRSMLLDWKLILWTIKIIFVPESTEGVDEEKTTAIQ